MSKKYKQIIEDLEKAVEDIRTKGISIEPLNIAIADLKAHSENINAIEENIDAVKSEVITPIKEELDQNKKTGKFSIWGFYVGAFGLLVTAVSLLYTSFMPPQPVQIKMLKNSDSTNTSQFNIPKENLINIENSLKEITHSIHGLDENYIPKKNEFLLKNYNKVVLLESDSFKLTVEAYIPSESKIEGRYYPFVSLKFFINGKQLGTKGLKEKVSLMNKSGVSHSYPNWSSLWITENDGFVILDKFKFTIVRIYRKESQILTLADKENGVLIKKVE